MPRRASTLSPTMPPLSTSSSSSTSSSTSSSLLATAAAAAAAAVLLCSSLLVSSAHAAADFVAPGSIVGKATTTNSLQLQAPPSRAKGLARTGKSASPSPPPPSPPPSIELLSGRVRVSDGDTVEITSAADGTKHKIRIWGIDAPETKQLCRDAQGKDYECGKKATEKMKELLGETATCEVKQRDQYGRAVARCYRGIKTERELEENNNDGDNNKSNKSKSKNLDAGLALVESGDAVAYRQFSKGFYEPAEKISKEKKIGIWSGEFEVRRRERRCSFFRCSFFRFFFSICERGKKTHPSLSPKTQNKTRTDPGGLAARPADQDPAEHRGAARAEPRRGRGRGGEELPALAPKPVLPTSPPRSPSPSPSPPASPSPSPSSPSTKRDHDKDGCSIKGNIASNGSKRYHVPGTIFYESVKIDEDKGERWFCSEEEARGRGVGEGEIRGQAAERGKGRR